MYKKWPCCTTKCTKMIWVMPNNSCVLHWERKKWNTHFCFFMNCFRICIISTLSNNKVCIVFKKHTLRSSLGHCVSKKTHVFCAYFSLSFLVCHNRLRKNGLKRRWTGWLLTALLLITEMAVGGYNFPCSPLCLQSGQRNCLGPFACVSWPKC